MEFARTFDPMTGKIEIDFVENYYKKKENKKKKEKPTVQADEESKGSASEDESPQSTPGKDRKVVSFSSEQGKGGQSPFNKSEWAGSKVQFKDFEILKVIGEGSFGRVYKGRKKDSGEVIALKVMKKQYLINNNQVKYAVSEAAIMKDLDHPYIMKLVFSFQTPSNLYMAVEYCENGDLAEILDQHSLLDEEVAKFLVAELILGMKYMHEKGVIFRDLKPENILIDSEGHIRLADFGLAKQDQKAVGKRDFKASSFCGSPAYLAPEMLKKQGVSKSGDVYQVGVVLYEMMVGIPPFYNDNMKILYENIEKGKLKLPKYLSNEARKIILKMLNRDPKKRPTLEQLVKDPFFADIDWELLANKKLQPPVVLRREPELTQKVAEKEEDQTMLFET